MNKILKTYNKTFMKQCNINLAKNSKQDIRASYSQKTSCPGESVKDVEDVYTLHR